MNNNDIDPRTLELGKLSDQALRRFAISTANGAMEKSAADTTSEFIRRRVYEDSFAPGIIKYTEYTTDNLTTLYGAQRHSLVVMGEMETAQQRPTTISIDDSADATTVADVDQYLLEFSTNTSPTWELSTLKLLPLKTNVRELITDRAMRDLSCVKDYSLIKAVNDLVGLPNTDNPETGLKQNIVVANGLSRENLQGLSTLFSSGARMLPEGINLINSNTFGQVTTADRNTMGGDLAQKVYLEGVGAFKTENIWGMDFLITRKNDLVPDGVVYKFTAADYLGRAGYLQQPQMYVEKKKNILTFSIEEIVGVSIVNIAGIQKVKFAAYNTTTDQPYIGMELVNESITTDIVGK